MAKAGKKDKRNEIEGLNDPVDEIRLASGNRKINKFDQVITTGSTLLDLDISGGRIKGGGIPAGILIEIFGPSGSGKTGILAAICGSIQRQGGEVDIKDPESRLDQEYSNIYKMKLNPNEYSCPNTVEEVFDSLYKKRYKNVNVINGSGIDSLAALSTDLELTKGDKMGMRRAKDFSTGLRKIARKITNDNLIVVCTNQVRQSDYGEVTPGGLAIAFYASLRIKLKQEEMMKKEVKLKSGVLVTKVVGIRSSYVIKKSSIDAPYREGQLYILFGLGIDDVRGNLQYIKDMTGGNVYDCFDKTYQSMEHAIAYIEKNNYEDRLKQKTIEVWEEVEEAFAKFKRKNTISYGDEGEDEPTGDVQGDGPLVEGSSSGC